MIASDTERWRMKLVTGDVIEFDLYDNFEDLQKTFAPLTNVEWKPLQYFYQGNYERGLREMMGMSNALVINRKLIRPSAIAIIEKV